MLTLNCDLGEIEGMSGLEDILALIDLANVCCGEHAGSMDLMRQTIAAAAKAGVRVGAHPGYPDREHFGRRPLFGKAYQAGDIEEMVAGQVERAAEAAREAGIELFHVKPHGALYNEAAVEGEVAAAIAAGVHRVCRDVFLVGLAGSVMVKVFRRQGFVVLREGFADRRYTEAGLLLPRTEPGAMIHDTAEAVRQLPRLADRCDTICVHGDSPGALGMLKALRQALAQG